jgi:hypothetical protein
MSEKTKTKTQTIVLPKVYSDADKKTLAKQLDKLAMIRAAQKKLKAIEAGLADAIKTAMDDGINVVSNVYEAFLSAEGAPSYSYDIAKAEKILTKAQMIQVCKVDGSKLAALIKSKELKPQIEVQLRVGKPTVAAGKLLIRPKAPSTITVG